VSKVFVVQLMQGSKTCSLETLLATGTYSNGDILGPRHVPKASYNGYKIISTVLTAMDRQ
jgi:hypothetical protein